MEKTKKHNSNMTISSRIALSATLGTVIPLIIVFIFSTVFLTSMSSYFNFSTVSTNSYSMLNQIQWAQTMATLSNELVDEAPDSEKVENIKQFVEPIENLGTKIYIGSSNGDLYSTTSRQDTMATANSIVKLDEINSVNYFGENGMVIVAHATSETQRYSIVITNEKYTVRDVTSIYSAQDFTSLVFGKTGLFILFLTSVFVLALTSLSLIMSRAITKPITKLSNGANEIANGNLDYEIDYVSTNEIGTTVKSFNDMAKRLKSSLDEQSQLEESRKEMIAGVAHDLRTPLTSAKGYVEGLIDGIANTPEKQERYLKTIYNSTCDMEKMLDELLTISRLELGKIELEKSHINVNTFMNDFVDEMRIELEKRDFDFEYRNHCDEKACFDVDTDKFVRVFANILSNAIKYKRNDVKSKVELEVQSYQKSILITFADNGIGVEKGNLDRIFDSFYRADKARTNVRNGSGIGLSVCKQIVELHGGHIWASAGEINGLKILISLERGQDDDSKQTENINC